MIKIVDRLVRKDGYSHEDVADRWQGEHADLAKEPPGIRGSETSLPLDPDDAEYDGVLELAFDDVDAMRAAFDSVAGRAVMEDAAAFVDLDVGPTLTVQETVQLPETDD